MMQAGSITRALTRVEAHKTLCKLQYVEHSLNFFAVVANGSYLAASIQDYRKCGSRR